MKHPGIRPITPNAFVKFKEDHWFDLKGPQGSTDKLLGIKAGEIYPAKIYRGKATLANCFLHGFSVALDDVEILENYFPPAPPEEEPYVEAEDKPEFSDDPDYFGQGWPFHKF